MPASFHRDPHPGRPRILFVGLSESSHTHAWIDLLEGAELNVRLFATPSARPPDEWPVKTYVTHPAGRDLDPATRCWMYPRTRIGRLGRHALDRVHGRDLWNQIGAFLASVLRDWRPHVIHTLGIEAGEFYNFARHRYGGLGIGKWVLQLRGGSDMTLPHLDPARRDLIAYLLRECDRLLTDNRENLRIGRELGVREEQVAVPGTVPGTGGIAVEALRRGWKGEPGRRRAIVWPKAYECPWSKSVPVIEALRTCWERLLPFELHLLAMDAETQSWYWSLPEALRRHCRPEERLPRFRALERMAEARVMLAPSLIDGTPNVLFEAMASGALPIVSPLETIRPLVRHEENVLFARNLYPDEIAAALVRAMSDDALVSRVATANLELVPALADRGRIRERVLRFYEDLATPA